MPTGFGEYAGTGRSICRSVTVLVVASAGGGRFLAYFLRGGRVLGAGLVEQDGSRYVLARDFTELTREEYLLLVENTPPELVAPIHRARRPDLAAAVIGSLILRDPSLRLLQRVDAGILRIYILHQRDATIRAAAEAAGIPWDKLLEKVNTAKLAN